MDSGKSEILQLLANQEQDLGGFLPHLESLREIISNAPEKSDSNIILSTIHSSKGLEYDRVYMIDMFEGIMPSVSEPGKGAKDEEIALYEEERRLYYVAMTRAKNELYIFTRGSIQTSAFSKKVFGTKQKPIGATSKSRSMIDSRTTNYALESAKLMGKKDIDLIRTSYLEIL